MLPGRPRWFSGFRSKLQGQSKAVFRSQFRAERIEGRPESGSFPAEEEASRVISPQNFAPLLYSIRQHEIDQFAETAQGCALDLQADCANASAAPRLRLLPS